MSFYYDARIHENHVFCFVATCFELEFGGRHQPRYTVSKKAAKNAKSGTSLYSIVLASQTYTISQQEFKTPVHSDVRYFTYVPAF